MHDASEKENGVIYVSIDGVDTPECGIAPGTSGCKTISHAAKVSSYPKALRLTPGIYIQPGEDNNNSVMVDEIITLTGESIKETIVAKETNSWFIFFILKGENFKLTIQNLTLIVNNHSEGRNTFRCEGGYVAETSHSEISFINVLFKMNESVGFVFGRTFFGHNSGVNVTLLDCHITNVSSINPVLYCNIISTLHITNTSFANITTLNSTLMNRGGCFFINEAFRLYIERSLFVTISSGGNGGVGYVQKLNGSGGLESAIVQSSFWNIFAGMLNGGFAGALYVRSSEHCPAHLSITDTSFLRVTANATYAAGVFVGNYITLVFTKVSFVSVKTNRSAVRLDNQDSDNGGGAVSAYGEGVSVQVTRSVFMDCAAGCGGGICAGNGSNVTLSDTVFAGNIAYMQTMGKGLDVYHDAESVVTASRSYTDNTVALACGDVGDCPLLSLDFSASTCSSSFLPKDSNDASPCPMPCASDRGVCGWPSACPSSSTSAESFASYPILDVCVPACAFRSASSSDGDGRCSAQCVVDGSVLMGDLCTAVCEPAGVYDAALAVSPGRGCHLIDVPTPPPGQGDHKTKKNRGGIVAAVVIVILVVVVVVGGVIGFVVWRKIRKEAGYTMVSSGAGNTSQTTEMKIKE